MGCRVIPYAKMGYWELDYQPKDSDIICAFFEIKDALAAFYEVQKCREAYPNHYIKVTAYDPRHARQTTAFDFIVNRPAEEPGFQHDRTESKDRVMNYTLRPYAHNKPHGQRYGNDAGNGS